MQKALLNFRGRDSIVDQVEGFGPEIQPIIRDFLQVEHLSTPADPFQDGPQIDGVARRSLDQVLLDPSRERPAADAPQRWDAILRHKEKWHERPAVLLFPGSKRE